MVVYIAGKMNGLPDKGGKAFADAQERLERMGVTVLNPACLPDGMPGDRYMPICLAMVGQADAMVMLPGWEDSPGALIEKALAEYQKKQVYMLGEFERMQEEHHGKPSRWCCNCEIGHRDHMSEECMVCFNHSNWQEREKKEE